MPDFGSRKALIWAVLFATFVVALSLSGMELFMLPSAVPLYVLPFVALYFVVRWAVSAGMLDASKKGAGSSRRTAREILDQRYAVGDFGREEYERMRQDLETV